MKNYQERKKFFFASPKLFPKWDYPSRLAIGMKFSDFTALNAPLFHFKVKGKMYEIDRDRALELGNKYKLGFGLLPNLIPVEEFREVPL